VPLSRVSQDSIESFCKHCQGAMKITTRSIAQEQHAEVAAEVVQEVLQDDLYQDPIQVSWSVCEFTFRLFLNNAFVTADLLISVLVRPSHFGY